MVHKIETKPNQYGDNMRASDSMHDNKYNVPDDQWRRYGGRGGRGQVTPNFKSCYPGCPHETSDIIVITQSATESVHEIRTMCM